MAEMPPQETDEEPEGPAATPFDNPYFLPVLLWLFAGWFMWDAWIKPMEDHLSFNRYGFGVMLGFAVHSTIQAVRPTRYLFAGLMLVYAAWFGYMGFLGSSEEWQQPLLDRWGSGAFVVAAGIVAIREKLRGPAD